MRLVRTIGLAALAAMATMAIVGASPASANFDTVLCKSHTSSKCPEAERITSGTIHLTNEGLEVGKLLNNLVDVLCLNVLVLSLPLGLGTAPNPQLIHNDVLTISGCGTDASHDNCTVTVNEQSLFHLLSLGLDEGTLLGLNGKTRVMCEDVIFGIDIYCEYDTTGLLLKAESGHVTASKSKVDVVAGAEDICPDESFLDFLLKPLEDIYVSGNTPGTALCKSHSAKKCEEKDQVKSLHAVTTTPPVLYNTIANIECESSLANATVLGLGEPQKLDVTELTWKECHTQGAADNCTVTTKTLPTVDLKKTALNLGTATALGLKIGIDCLVLGLIDLDCVYGGDVEMQAEGALHKTGTGHGMLTAAKVVVKKLEGGGHCPESVKWNALYEPLEHVYIVE